MDYVTNATHSARSGGIANDCVCVDPWALSLVVGSSLKLAEEHLLLDARGFLGDFAKRRRTFTCLRKSIF